MNPTYFIDRLESNLVVFSALLIEPEREEYSWRPAPEKWNQLEILCHLYDEEREDFKGRLRHVLEHPQDTLPQIDPAGWVTERKYAERNYADMLLAFTDERKQSVQWLRSLTNPLWSNAYQHPKFGALTAEMFLVNWVAHDYLHFRQLTRLKYQYLQTKSLESLKYAGDW